MKKQSKSLKALHGIPQFKPYSYVVALDIETSSKGELLDIGCYSETDYKVFGHWFACLKWLMTLCEIRQENIRVIAHNGFGFDFVNLLPWLLEHLEALDIDERDINFFMSESLTVGAAIRRGEHSIELFDTLRLFPATSLENLAKDFLGAGKIDIPEKYKSKMEQYKKLHPKKYYAYLKRDCESLYQIYCKFREEVNQIEAIGELGFSSGSTAFRAYRRYLAHAKPTTWIYSLAREYQVSKDEKISGIAIGDEAMQGGLTAFVGDATSKGYQWYPDREYLQMPENFPYDNLFMDVWSYDVISMYPHSMMFTPVPSCEPEFTKKLKRDSGELLPGYYLCDYHQTVGRVPFIKPLRQLRKHDDPTWTGTAMLCTDEIKWFQEYGEIKVHEGIYYPEFEMPFRSFLERMLEQKQNAKALGQTAKTYAYKILANSLYGKFAQRATKHIMAITGDRDWYHNLLTHSNGHYMEYYNGSRILYGYDVISSAFSNRLIGAMVTARSRLKLGLVMNTVGTIYVDTDSIFTQEKLDSRFIGDRVGQFELKDKDCQTMICLGKKLYRYGDAKHAKGVPSKSITDDHFYRIASGEKVRIDYRSPTALKTALKKEIKNPNKFEKRFRTLKKFPSMFEQGLIDKNGKLLNSNDVAQFLESIDLL